MPKVVHFELPFDDAGRAKGFYAEVFGWQSRQWDGPEEYYLQETGPAAEAYGIGGGADCAGVGGERGRDAGGHRGG